MLHPHPRGACEEDGRVCFEANDNLDVRHRRADVAGVARQRGRAAPARSAIDFPCRSTATRALGWPAGRGAWGPYPGYYGAPYYERGSLRIQVKPEDTEVYVDGYYAGVVDSYDGFFQRLHLPAGAHDIELRLEGYRSIQEQVYLTVGSTYRIEHQMEPLAPGETTPPPPAPPVQAEPSVPRLRASHLTRIARHPPQRKCPVSACSRSVSSRTTP